MFERLPHVLFVCVENSCRSQMAEEFARASRIEGPAKKASPKILDTPLGDPVRDLNLGIEIRVPKGATKKEPSADWIKLSWMCGLPDGTAGTIQIGRADPEEDVAAFVLSVKMGKGGDGFEVTSERRDDWATGASVVLESRREKDRMVTVDLFYEMPGRSVMLGFSFGAERTAQWKRISREVVAAFRTIAAPDGVLEPPAGAETSEEGDLVFLAPAKAIPPKALKDDLAAGLALARDLTGGPAPERKIAVHVFPDAARIRKATGALEADAPPAVYVPAGRVLLANALPAAAAARPLGSRCEAVLLAYLDAWLGTPRGVPPWIEAALRESARAAKVAAARQR